MYCNYCGKVIQEDHLLCAYCGKRVGAEVSRRRLVRPREGRVFAGVYRGFAKYFDLDVALIRVAWVLVALFAGGGVLAYIIAWIVVPNEPERLPVPAAPPVPAENP